MWLGLPWGIWALAAVALFGLAFLSFAAWQVALSERKLAEAGRRWERNGCVVMAGDGSDRRVIIGETCGSPTEAVAEWAVARRNYDLLPWYQRAVTRQPRLPREA